MVKIIMTTQQAITVCHALRLSQRATQDARDIIDRHHDGGDSYVVLNEVINDLVCVRSDLELKLRAISEARAKEQSK